MVKRLAVSASLAAVAAVVAIIAIVALGSSHSNASAAGVPQWSAADARATLHQIFPAVADTAPDPAFKTDGNIVAQARLTDANGSSWSVAATDKQTICASSEGTTTCQPVAAVRTGGIFFAAVNCDTRE